AAGVVHHVRKEGDTVSVGEVIARIDEGTVSAVSKTPTASMTTRVDEQAAEQTPAPPATAAAASAPATSATAATATAPVGLERHGPAVRRLLDENKLDPGQIQGSGPDGRITKEDVLKFLEARR